jgi:hypothetical protein
MTSCHDAFVHNIYIDLTNFDNDIKYALERRKLRKKWIEAANGRASKISAKTAEIEAKYDSGFYVSKSYNVPSSITSKYILNRFNVSNLDDFWKSKIVGYNTGRIESCPNQGAQVFCKDVSERQEKLCCECGKNYTCNPGSGGCDAWAGGLDGAECKLKANTNLFQVQIDIEVAAAIEEIDRDINKLKNDYELYEQRDKLTPSSIGCCQYTEFKGISASNIIFDNIKNECSIAKSS